MRAITIVVPSHTNGLATSRMTSPAVRLNTEVLCEPGTARPVLRPEPQGGKDRGIGNSFTSGWRAARIGSCTHLVPVTSAVQGSADCRALLSRRRTMAAAGEGAARMWLSFSFHETDGRDQ